jgi:hypothetical protein
VGSVSEECEEGWYWVRDRDGDWLIARWREGRWWEYGWDAPLRSEEVAEIDERRIVRSED